jgi:hypothetical protein
MPEKSANAHTSPVTTAQAPTQPTPDKDPDRAVPVTMDYQQGFTSGPMT